MALKFAQFKSQRHPGDRYRRVLTSKSGKKPEYTLAINKINNYLCRPTARKTRLWVNLF
jgi:hypothetical protein